MRYVKAIWPILIALLLAPSLALAQANNCRIPASIPATKPEAPKPDERRVSPVEGYTLALSWSPEYCFTHKDDEAAQTQCDGKMGSFGFILHGLWPEGATAAYPQWCEEAKPLPASLVRAQMCVTPSAQLIQHEWAKHGVCSGVEPARYFKAAAILYGAMAWPDMASLARRRVTVGAFTAAFIAANRGLTPAMIRIQTSDKGWLEEVRLCLDKNYRSRVCPAFAKGAPANRMLRIGGAGK